jgi:hypothetical protein
MDVLQAYVRDADLFRDHAGAGLLLGIGPNRDQQVEGLQDGVADTAATVQGVATGNDCAVMVLISNAPLSLSMSHDGTERAGMACR